MKIAYIDLNTDIEKEIKQVKLRNEHENIKEAQGMHLLSKITGILPALLSKIISLDLSRKVSLVYSKFPPLKTPLTFLGKQSSQFLILAPLMGGLNPNINIVFHCGMVKLLCLSDESCISDPQLLISFFNRNVEMLLKKHQTLIDN